jgi:hypothetical protein
MNKKLIMLISVSSLVVTIVITGCTSTAPAPPKPSMVDVEFPENEKSIPLFRIQDRNNPREVITFARSLSAVGRYKESAAIYLDAAKRFKSASGNFEIDCQMAAVREFWLAGEFGKAHKLLDKLEKEQDIYNRAGESKDIRRLRSLLRDSEAIRQSGKQS